MPAYRVEFPGLQITRCDFLWTHGVHPSVAVMQCVAVDPGAGFGDLVFYDGETELMRFRDCAIEQDTMSPPMERRGFRMRVCVLDRRWRWRYQLISGRYNVRLPDSTIHPDTQATYYQLVEILLQALGETAYDIVLPDPDLDAPEVDWFNARADLELSHLCDRIGCLITQDLTGRVRIVSCGSGPIYPANGLELMPFIDTTPAARPKDVQVTFAPTRFQMLVDLEAVGLDSDGDIKPIDELSYKPSAGWTGEVPAVFANVTSDADRELARLSVYRWYRVKELHDAGLTLPIADHQIEQIEDILPLLPELLEVGSEHIPQQSQLEGAFFAYDLSGLNANDGEWAVWDDNFVLDRQRGIVQLPYPVYLVDDDGHQTPAELALKCAFHARDGWQSGWYFAAITKPIDSPPHANASGAARVDEFDMWRAVIQQYGTDGTPSSVDDNKTDIDEHGTRLANAYASHWRAVPKLSMQWNGIVPFALDGNVHFLRWQLGGGTFLTWGGKNVTYPHMTPVRSERRLRDEVQRSHRL